MGHFANVCAPPDVAFLEVELPGQRACAVGRYCQMALGEGQPRGFTVLLSKTWECLSPPSPTQGAVKPLISAALLGGKWCLGADSIRLLLFQARLGIFSAPSPMVSLFLSIL